MRQAFPRFTYRPASRTANICDECGRRGLSHQRHRLARATEDGMNRLAVPARMTSGDPLLAIMPVGEESLSPRCSFIERFS